MPDFDAILKSVQQEKFEHLIKEPETQEVFSMLRKNAGVDLEKAAERAANGDASQLMDAIRQLMQNPESARLIQQMKSKLK